VALPSSVTLGSLALVVTAGAGLVAVTAYANRDDAAATPESSPTATAQTPKPKPEPKPKPKPKPAADVVPETVVEVYNNSGISGLAADRAAELESAGWHVGGTDNWYGDIADNTVYYPADLKAEAKQLAETMDITRVKPAVSGMQLDRLTVILTHS
jgi:hypothetical protein